MKCNCGSDRVLSVSGKTSDCFSMSYKDKDANGYVPSGLNIGGGDYLEFKLCLECGKIQGQFPVTDEQVVYEFDSM